VFGNSLTDVLLRLPALLVAISCHEGAHAWTADRLGDPTPRQQGRLTLDPRAHMDPLGTLLILVAPIGWGRPVQVRPDYFRSPLEDNARVSFAGPLANLVVAVTAALLLRLLVVLVPPAAMQQAPAAALVVLALQYMVVLNALLAVFNLLPIPPLDGSKILAALWPALGASLALCGSTGCGMAALLFLVLSGGIRLLMTPLRLLLAMLTGPPLMLALATAGVAGMAVAFGRSMQLAGRGGRARVLRDGVTVLAEYKVLGPRDGERPH